ncbi:MAG: LLM class F420-dependent oxidoreductase [Gammaproteobacteria bacterium]|nr:LLM class F420-dependent oxidoreductase [Gammaproteobacteria bacterium]
MHFGISVPNNQGVRAMGDLVELAVEAEAMGYQSAWVSDHLFHAEYVAKRLDDRPYHEPLTVLTAIAARTEAIELGTSVLVLPWHHPVRLAKTIASLDDYSGGRVNLGVGVGVTQDEYAALGVPFAERGRIADEMLGAMRALWTQAVPEFHGKYYDFAGLRFEPKPMQTPYPTIWVGGNSPAAHRRLCEFGEAWHPLGIGPDDLALKADELAERLRAVGREPQVPIAVRLMLEFRDEASDYPIGRRKTCKGTPAEMIALIDAFANAGVTHVIVDGGTHHLDEATRAFEKFSKEVVPAVNA